MMMVMMIVNGINDSHYHSNFITYAHSIIYQVIEIKVYSNFKVIQKERERERLILCTS